MKRVVVVASLCRSESDERMLRTAVNEELGPEHDLVDLVVTHSKEEYAKYLGRGEVLFAYRLPSDRHEFLREAAKLKWIQIAGAGLDESLDDEVIRRGFMITNARGIHAGRVAEYVMGSIIAYSKGFFKALRHQAERRWARAELTEANRTLAGKTLGIMGLGALGTQVARVAKPFGLEVTALRRHPEDHPRPAEVSHVFGPQNLREFIHPLDFLVLAVPLTKETRHVIDHEELVRLKTSSLLVNVSRGAVIDETALVAALREGEIGGAVLDVFEEEPLPQDSPLWTMDNVFITPHVAGAWTDYLLHASRLFARNLRNYLEKRRLENLVDPGRGY